MKRNNISETYDLLWTESYDKAYEQLKIMRMNNHLRNLEKAQKEKEKEQEKDKKQQKYKKALRYL